MRNLDIPNVPSEQVGTLIGVGIAEAMVQHEWIKGSRDQP